MRELHRRSTCFTTGRCAIVRSAMGTAALVFAATAVTDVAAQTCTPHWDSAAESAGESTRIRGMTLFDDGTGETVWAVRAAFSSTPAALLRWNAGTSQWDTVTTIAMTGAPRAIAAFSGALYIGGDFTSIDGAPIGAIARWTGSSWAALGGGLHVDAGFPPAVNDLYVWDDGTGPALYVGGEFEHAGTVAARNIARWNGLNWHNLGSGTQGGTNPFGGTSWGTVATINSFDDGSGDALYVGGGFHGAGDVPSHGIARWRLGEGWSSVGGGVALVPGWCCAVVLSLQPFDDGSGNALYVGGFFHDVGGEFVPSLARWDGSSWSSVGGLLMGDGWEFGVFINAMAVFNDGDGPALYVAGEIEDADGFTVGNVAKWDGTSWSGPPAVIEDAVYNIQSFHDGQRPTLHVATFRDSFLWSGCSVDLAVDPDTSDLQLTRAVISSFGGLTTVIVTPRDADGEIVEATSVTLTTTAGELVGPVIDMGDGRFSQDLVAQTGATGATISATVDGVELTNSIDVSFVAVDPTRSTVHVSHAQTFVGGHATITVTLRDDANAPVTTSHNVVISTTLGELSGSVSYAGLAQYNQNIVATQVGTAAITATADGLPLETSASLAVLDPLLFGSVIGEDEDGNLFAFMAIQTAINASESLNLRTIFVAPGEYDETILIEDREDLAIEALSATDPVAIQGAIISRSNDVALRYFDIDGTETKRDAILLRGQKNASTGVELAGLVITGASWNGIAVGVDNEAVSILDCVIHGNDRNGILFERTGGPYLVDGCAIFDNGHNGIYIGREVEVTISYNEIYENGTATGQGGGRYGVFRERQPQDGSPEQVTLIGNEITDNHGRIQPNRSDVNVGNVDQIIDETDDQLPYAGNGE